jgi:chorismate mutase
MHDKEVERWRGEITAIDRSIIDAVNRRLELVAELKRYKAEHGISFVDPEREAAMVEERSAENSGPLSEAGLRALQAELLALTKRELDAP